MKLPNPFASQLEALNARMRKTERGLRVLIGRSPTGHTAPNAPRGPDWMQASPTWIANALSQALERDGGGWFALDRREAFAGAGPFSARVNGHTFVLWRDTDGALLAAPDTCPHLGASLSTGRVVEGKVVCPWHGLRLDKRGFRDWHCHLVHDDGVIVWLRLPTPGESQTDLPFLPPRPASGVAATISADLRCDPQDVLANRLDPWHGAHYHPHSFGELEVLERTSDEVRVRVVYRVVGPIGVEVDATFRCPDPRTIVMTIVSGDGVGSVVETHATPIAPGLTRLVETTIATSDRQAFGWVERLPFVAHAMRPMIEARAKKLWVEDIAYAERRYALRMSAAAVVSPSAAVAVVPKLVPSREANRPSLTERRPHR